MDDMNCYEELKARGLIARVFDSLFT